MKMSAFIALAAGFVSILLCARCTLQAQRPGDLEHKPAGGLSSPSLDSLLRLTEQMSLKAISEGLSATPREVKPLPGGRRAIIASAQRPEDYFGDHDFAIGPDGELHCVFESNSLLNEKDALGNDKRWRCVLYYTRQTKSGWSTPELVMDDLLSINSRKVLIRAQGTVHVLAGGRNGSTKPNAMGLPPGEIDLLIWTRRPDGSWPSPTRCGAPRRGLVCDFDACLDGEGNICVARPGPMTPLPSREREPGRFISTIEVQVCRKGDWQPPVAMAKVQDRALSHLRVFFKDGRLRLLAAGQYGVTGTYVGVADRSCPEMQLLRGGTSFCTTASSAPGQPVLAGALFYPGAFPAFDREGCALLDVTSKDAPIETGRTFAFGDRSIECFSGWGGADAPSLDVDAAGRPYLLAERSGNVFLLRLDDAGKMQGVCIYAARQNDSRAANVRLFIRNGRAIALWTVAEQHRRQAIHCYEGPIPEAGWQDADSLLWRSRAGLGLSREDWQILAGAVLRQARVADWAGDVSRAIDRYLYVLTNQHREFFDLATDRAAMRLASMDEAGVTEVRRRIAGYSKAHPEFLDPKKTHLVPIPFVIDRLRIKPEAVEELAGMRPQDSATISRVLGNWDCKPLDVSLPSQRLVRVRPERAVLKEAQITPQQFKKECAKRLPQQPPQYLGYVKFETGPSVNGIWTMRALDDLANWEVMPAGPTTKP